MLLSSLRKGSYKAFLTLIGQSALSHETHHSGHTARVYGGQKAIQKLEPYAGHKQFACLLTLLPLSSRGYCFPFKCSVTAVTPPPFASATADQLTDSLSALNSKSQGGALQFIVSPRSTRYRCGVALLGWLPHRLLKSWRVEIWPVPHRWSSWQGRVQKPVAKRQEFPDSEMARQELWL